MRRFAEVCFVCFVIGMLVSPVMTADPKPRRLAILVGINAYSNRLFEDLKYAERDMEKLAEQLAVVGFEVHLLLGSGRGDREATRQNVVDVLLNQAEANRKFILRDITAQDTVLIAFSGHGEQIPVPILDNNKQPKRDGEGKVLTEEVPFFCPKHAESGNANTQVSINAVLETLDQKKATSLVLVDACRKYTAPVMGKKSGAKVDRAKVSALRPGIGVMFACSDRQEALENVKAGDGHGLFFCAVLEAMKECRPNKKGQVTWGQLVPLIQARVVELADEIDTTTPKERRQKSQYIGNFTDDPVIVVNLDRRGTPPPIPNSKPIAKPDTQPTPNSEKTLTLDLGKGVKLDLVRIPKGSFTMGSPATEPERKEDEKQHEVEITKDFYMGKYEVTQKQYEVVMKENPSNFGPAGKSSFVAGLDTRDFPVDQVSWNDAVKYCEHISKITGRTVRLPTEAEWEYACRGGTTTPFSFGVGLTAKEANFHIQSGIPGQYLSRTCRVGSYPPNKFGLFDMHGNVPEWCLDWYDYDYYKTSPREDPLNDRGEIFRVFRGGAYNFSSSHCRAAARGRERPESATSVSHHGFRVVVQP